MKVWLFAACLLGSACNRAAESDAVAHADGEEASAGSENAAMGDELAFEEADEEDADAELVTPEDEAKAKVEQAVAQSRSALDAERLALDTRKAEIDAAAAELEARLGGIAELERRLDERIGAGETARQRKSQRIGVLAKLIMSMPPQSAAAMVEKMSDEDAQALILQMSQENERKASKLLSALPGERAAQLGQLYLDSDPKTIDARKAEAAKPAEEPTGAVESEDEGEEAP